MSWYNNNNNNPICKAPEYQKTSVALADRNRRMYEINRIKSPTEQECLLSSSITSCQTIFNHIILNLPFIRVIS